MCKLTVERVPKRTVEVIELCLPSVSVGLAGAKASRHGIVVVKSFIEPHWGGERNETFHHTDHCHSKFLFYSPEGYVSDDG